ncbi:undecaprenyl-diphosphate phosphatase [Segetibacter sp. 3557_3]|uniref:undecaprenyl-diphosphate phosphatase n=1 Tax=Segetibacter sp. 3557_3 TaxID=2547429 RepID=UPI001058A9BB|nr:undecaprenyl-diphosphate phosphatase [Segetibacter sp. 3557_3]TDH22966.1 undecaprenyl-diphosphate phosphatase [Segetibacter sp. 3557_3]
MSTVESIIIAIVEGLTEFLPISSTGHMIIAERLLRLPKEDTFIQLFTVAIQLGAILSVVVLYWRKFFDFSKWQFYLKLVVAVLPALAIGFVLSDKIDELLDSPLTVAITMLLGGIVLLFIDRAFKNPVVEHEKDITYTKALVIGLWQCVAMVPGVSRSAASIIGGMQQSLTRKLAAEFSFFLAVPTMAAATGYKLLKTYKEHPEVLSNTQNLGMLAIGNVVAFVVAMLAIKFFIGYLQKYGFKLFGWYRIIGGAILLAMISSGYIS